MNPEQPDEAHDTTGCDCPTCLACDDRWCCRTCHDLARSV